MIRTSGSALQGGMRRRLSYEDIDYRRGRLKERYLKDAVAEYTKRLSRFAAVDLMKSRTKKIPDNAGEKQQAQLLEKKGGRFCSISRMVT